MKFNLDKLENFEVIGDFLIVEISKPKVNNKFGIVEQLGDYSDRAVIVKVGTGNYDYSKEKYNKVVGYVEGDEVIVNMQSLQRTPPFVIEGKEYFKLQSFDIIGKFNKKEQE